jgi:uncharacterized protein YdhG (YjbR/CyaY superfamily)
MADVVLFYNKNNHYEIIIMPARQTIDDYTLSANRQVYDFKKQIISI